MRLLSLSTLCIAAFVAVQAQEREEDFPVSSTMESLNYCKANCAAPIDWTTEECIELCLDYYDVHPIPHQPSYPSEEVLSMESLSVPKTDNANVDIVNALRQQINYLRQDVPWNFNNFFTVNNISNTVVVHETDYDGVEGFLAQWNLDARTASFLRNIKFADSGNIHTLGFNVQELGGGVVETVAAGSNYNGKIALAFIRTSANGLAKYQNDCITNCRRTLFRKKCKTDCYTRAFTSDELMVIQLGLLGSAYNLLEAKFAEL